MKSFNKIKAGSMLLLACVLPFAGCKKYLESEFHSNLPLSFFSTPDGLEGGVTAAYSINRFFWGSEGTAYSANAGVDEVVLGATDGGQSFFNYSIVPTEGTTNSLWNNSYQAINGLNGVIKFGPGATMDAVKKSRLIAEAKFMRAFYYLLLVQNFGDVSLNLDFVEEPSTSASRQPIAEVYAAIIKDLNEALTDLPAVPSTKSRAGKAAALYLLAKTYLTRGWSAAAQPGDFATAYNHANTLLSSPATYGVGLEPDYAKIFANGNESGQESIFIIDRNTDRLFSESAYNNDAAGVPNAGNKENRLNHFWVNFYTNPFNVNSDGTASGNLPGSTASSQSNMSRDVVNGRSFRRFRPTNYTLNSFTQQPEDSRYDRTFQKVWIANTPSVATNLVQSTIATPVKTTRNGIVMTLTPNVDTVYYMPGKEVTIAERQAFKGVYITPSQYTNDFYPTLLKHLDPTRQHYNDPSDRPIILFRMGDLVLYAAEAALKDNRPADALAMINRVRKRAAFRTSYPAGVTQASAETALVLTDPNTVNLDYILAERTRELYGENCRWYDLVRTGTLVARTVLYNSVSPVGTPTSINIPSGLYVKPYHVLRPIPQTQIDAVSTGPKYPQNPGY